MKIYILFLLLTFSSAFAEASKSSGIAPLSQCGKDLFCIKGTVAKGTTIQMFSILISENVCVAKAGSSFIFNGYVSGKKSSKDDEKQTFAATRITDFEKCAGWKMRKYSYAALGDVQKISLIKPLEIKDKKRWSEIDKLVKASKLWNSDDTKTFTGTAIKTLDPVMGVVESIPFGGQNVTIATYVHGPKCPGCLFKYVLKYVLVDDNVYEYPTSGMFTGAATYFSVGSSNYVVAVVGCRECDAWMAYQTFKVTKKGVELYATEAIFGVPD